MKKNLYALLVLLFIGTGFTQSYATVIFPASSASITPDPATVKNAVDEFKTLSKRDRKSRIREIRQEIKAFKAAKKAGKETDTNTLLLVILAILLPPLAVYLYEGEINKRFWISLILTLLLWLPGIIYALIVILGGDD
jgi:uncharacterized membrane protein YqaE (UPF0057 family)